MISRSLTLRFLIDTNRINALRRLPAMNRLEKWYEDDVIELFIAEPAQWEATRSGSQQRTSKALGYIALEVLANTPEEQRTLRQIETMLFPRGPKDQNDGIDVKIVFTAWKYFACLITDDGDSKSQRGGILGHATELHNKLSVVVMRDTEAVGLVEKMIRERDAEARRIASTTGEALPEWIGND